MRVPLFRCQHRLHRWTSHALLLRRHGPARRDSDAPTHRGARPPSDGCPRAAVGVRGYARERMRVRRSNSADNSPASVSDLVGRDDLVVDPPVPRAAYRDGFGNWCTRIVAPKVRMRVWADALVNDTGVPTPLFPRRNRFPCRTCPWTRLSSCSGAGIAKPIGCRRRCGIFLGRRHRDGAVCKQSATTFTDISRLATSTPA